MIRAIIAFAIFALFIGSAIAEQSSIARVMEILGVKPGVVITDPRLGRSVEIVNVSPPLKDSHTITLKSGEAAVIVRWAD